MQIKVKKLNPWSKLPNRGSEYAAGYDLYADEDAEIEPGQTKLISTGIAVEIPEGYFGGIYARSGLATKQGLRPANCVGVIDSDYRNEIKVSLHNDNSNVSSELKQINSTTCEQILSYNYESTKTIHKGDRIAQLVIQKFEPICFVEVPDLDMSTDRGGGFGHTGN